MGDAADFNDIERFLRSPEGQGYLDDLRRRLTGRRIVDVTLINDTRAVGIRVHLEDGTRFLPAHISLDVEAIRDRFRETLDRERRRDNVGH